MDEPGPRLRPLRGQLDGRPGGYQTCHRVARGVSKLVVIGSAPVSQSLFVPTPLEGIKHIAGDIGASGPSMDKMRRSIEIIVYDQSLMTDEAVRERYEASLDPDASAS